MLALLFFLAAVLAQTETPGATQSASETLPPSESKSSDAQIKTGAGLAAVGGAFFLIGFAALLWQRKTRPNTDLESGPSRKSAAAPAAAAASAAAPAAAPSSGGFLCCLGARGPVSEAELVNRDIEKEIQQDKLKVELKVLLLGAGESGKTTILKQIKTMYKIPMDESEVKQYAYTLHNNTVQCMQVLLEAGENLGIALTSSEAKERAARVRAFEFASSSSFMPKNIGYDIVDLWTDADVQAIYKRRDEFWILDSAPYFFEHTSRFVEDGFVPTEDDIVMARIRTTGIVVTEFKDTGVNAAFKVVDVGGQRNERKKWLHCFDDVNCIVFAVNLAGYDAVMFEDQNKNMLQEAVELFGQIANNKLFESTPIVLFLNKKDLFESMIRKTPLSKCFPDYAPIEKEDPFNVSRAISFIESKFEAQMPEGHPKLRTFPISARFRKDVKYAWDDLKQELVAAHSAASKK